MRFELEPFGNHFTLEKGISYESENLVASSDVGLVTLDSFRPGGGYKTLSEKPFKGDFKQSFVLMPGEVVIAITDVTQDGSVLCAPALIPSYEDSYSELIWSLDVARLNPTSCRIRPEFAYNFLRVPINRERAAYGNSGTTVRRVPFEAMYEQLIPIPSIDDQDRINSFLALFDRRIDLCREIAELLGQLAIISYHDGLDRSLITKGEHESVSLGDICINVRQSVSAESLKPTDNYIGLDSMPRATPVLASWSRPEDIASTKSSFIEGDILFGKLRPYFRKAGVALIDGICSTDILVLKPKGDEWFSAVLSTVTDKRFIDFVTQGSSGTRMPRTSWKDMSEYEVDIPSQEINEELSDFARGCFRGVKSLVAQAHTLREIQSHFLPRLVSGQLQLDDGLEAP